MSVGYTFEFNVGDSCVYSGKDCADHYDGEVIEIKVNKKGTFYKIKLKEVKELLTLKENDLWGVLFEDYKDFLRSRRK